MSDFVNPETLKDLLKTNAEQRVIKRESNTLEFKADFDWKTKMSRCKYLKTVAAYANKKGGYIVFGIKNQPKDIVGIDKDFDDVDDADISSFFNSYLSPSVEYERTTIKIKSKLIGVIYIHESKYKPIVCIRSYDQILSEGSIYYRYNSQSDKIKSGDLINLLSEIRDKESQRWIDLFQKVSKIGIDNAGIMNMGDGELSSANGVKFILNEQLLGRLKIIDKYSKEKDGAPAVRIIGDIDSHGTIITKSRYLNDTEIILDFLEQKDVDNGQEYIKAICYQNSGMLPIYYYIHKAGLSIKETQELVKRVNKHSQAKTKLLARLANDEKLSYLSNVCSIKAATPIGQQRLKYYNDITRNKEVSVLDNGRQVKSLLESILSLEKDEFEPTVVFNILRDVTSKHYSNKNLASYIRNATTYIDFILYRHKIKMSR